jgi:hypothetical protein
VVVGITIADGSVLGVCFYGTVNSRRNRGAWWCTIFAMGLRFLGIGHSAAFWLWEECVTFTRDVKTRKYTAFSSQ